MRKAFSWIIGLTLGGALGAAIASFISPKRRAKISDGLKQHRTNAMEAARDAAVQRRSELEAELYQHHTSPGDS